MLRRRTEYLIFFPDHIHFCLQGGNKRAETKITVRSGVHQQDKTFPKSEKVDHRKVTFRNRYGITLAADLYQPKGAPEKIGGIGICGWAAWP